MTLAQFVQAVRRGWIAIAALTILGAIAGLAAAMLQTPVYAADSQLFVSVSDQVTNATDLSQGGAFAQNEVESFRDVVTSPLVLNPVLSHLNLGMSVQDLSSEVSVTVPLSTVLMDVTVKDTSPARAQAIANEVAREASVVIPTLLTPRGQTVSPVAVTVTQPATIPSSPASPRKTLYIAAGLLVGLLLGGGIVLGRESMGRRIGGQQPLDDIANAPVLGVIGEAHDMTKEPAGNVRVLPD